MVLTRKHRESAGPAHASTAAAATGGGTARALHRSPLSEGHATDSPTGVMITSQTRTQLAETAQWQRKRQQMTMAAMEQRGARPGQLEAQKRKQPLWSAKVTQQYEINTPTKEKSSPGDAARNGPQPTCYSPLPGRTGR